MQTKSERRRRGRRKEAGTLNAFGTRTRILWRKTSISIASVCMHRKNATGSTCTRPARTNNIAIPNRTIDSAWMDVCSAFILSAVGRIWNLYIYTQKFIERRNSVSTEKDTQTISKLLCFFSFAILLGLSFARACVHICVCAFYGETSPTSVFSYFYYFGICTELAICFHTARVEATFIKFFAFWFKLSYHPIKEEY